MYRKNNLNSSTKGQKISKANYGFLDSSKLTILSREDAQDGEFRLEELRTQ